MDLSLGQVQRTMIQTYEPTDLEPGRSPFDRFQRKEFSGAHLAELFHENSKIREIDQPRRLPSSALFEDDESMEVAQAFIEHGEPGSQNVGLPGPKPLEADLGRVLRTRRSIRSFTGEAIDLQYLADLLGYSCGVTAERPIEQAGSEGSIELTRSYRSYPSPGALYPVEIYVAVLRGGDDLPSGIYQYNADEHALSVVSDQIDKPEDALPPSMYGDSVDVDMASLVLFLVGVPWRAMAKYGAPGYRFVLEETGIITQNVLLVATALGLGGLPYAAFFDAQVDEFLGLDGLEESTMLSLPIGSVPEVDAHA